MAGSPGGSPGRPADATDRSPGCRRSGRCSGHRGSGSHRWTPRTPADTPGTNRGPGQLFDVPDAPKAPESGTRARIRTCCPVSGVCHFVRIRGGRRGVCGSPQAVGVRVICTRAHAPSWARVLTAAGPSRRGPHRPQPRTRRPDPPRPRRRGPSRRAAGPTGSAARSGLERADGRTPRSGPGVRRDPVPGDPGPGRSGAGTRGSDRTGSAAPRAYARTGTPARPGFPQNWFPCWVCWFWARAFACSWVCFWSASTSLRYWLSSPWICHSCWRRAMAWS
jgi:hypothetical protein